MQLYDYQTNGIDQLARNFANGITKQIYQLPTGGGKTICFSGLIRRYKERFDKNVLILVHRAELLAQARKTLYNHFQISSSTVEDINGGVIVAMVETANNRLKKNPKYFGDVGLLIIDECHIGNFKKIYEYFSDSLIIGFSATPISAVKKHPLNEFFDDIVTGPQISELIDKKSLSVNETYAIKGIERSAIKIIRGEYDLNEMSRMYSTQKNVYNVVHAYEKICQGEKTIVFNCNVEHSKLVNDAFISSGYQSRHLDGTEKDRVEILQWFKETDNAILNNIGVLTTGFDEPTIRNVIVNRSTTSLPLWLQMTGRGSRISNGKTHFRIIDMGGNAETHGDWRCDRDWLSIFDNPAKASEGGGVAPIRICEGCEAMLAASQRICNVCGLEKENLITYDVLAPEFEKIVGMIRVDEIIRNARNSGYKEWKPFFDILGHVITTLKYRIDHIDPEIKRRSYEQFELKVREWCVLSNRRMTKHIKDFAHKKFMEEIQKLETVSI